MTRQQLFINYKGNWREVTLEEKPMELKDIKAELRKLEESERQMHEKIEALNGLIAARESHKRAKAMLNQTEIKWKNDNE